MPYNGVCPELRFHIISHCLWVPLLPPRWTTQLHSSSSSCLLLKVTWWGGRKLKPKYSREMENIGSGEWRYSGKAFLSLFFPSPSILHYIATSGSSQEKKILLRSSAQPQIVHWLYMATATPPGVMSWEANKDAVVQKGLETLSIGKLKEKSLNNISFNITIKRKRESSNIGTKRDRGKESDDKFTLINVHKIHPHPLFPSLSQKLTFFFCQYYLESEEGGAGGKGMVAILYFCISVWIPFSELALIEGGPEFIL